VLASQPPVKPDPITTEINNLFVRVAWTAYINNNFEAFDMFQVLFKDSTGQFKEITANCDGTNAVILA
jgi:hypothetical protein